MSLFLQIGLGAGLAAAAGLRPFLPALLAGVLGSAGALDVGFSHGHLAFLQRGWFLGLTAGLLVLSYALQLQLGARRFDSGPLGAALSGAALAVGALLFAGTLSDHHNSIWAGAIAGLICAAIAQVGIRPVIAGARSRLQDRAAREAVTVYLDGVALVLAALSVLLKPLGLLAVLALAWLLIGSRRRAGERYAGLRILR